MHEPHLPWLRTAALRFVSNGEFQSHFVLCWRFTPSPAYSISDAGHNDASFSRNDDCVCV